MNTENKQNTEKSAGGNAASTQPAKEQKQPAENQKTAANFQNQKADNQNQAAETKQPNGEQAAPNADELTEQAKKAVTEEAGKVTEKVGKVLDGDTGAIKDVLGQVKESGGNLAGQAVGQVKETASSLINEQKTNLASGLGGIAETLRKVGGSLRETEGAAHGIADTTAGYGENLAQRVEEVSDYLENKDLGELLRDVETFARRNPAIFIGAAFAVGIAAGRFLRASNPNQPKKSSQNTARKTENTAAAIQPPNVNQPAASNV